MKNILGILAMTLALVATPALAQQTTHEDRTNPDADSIAPHSGLTITGTVEEIDDQQMTLRSETGAEQIQIMADTQGVAGVEVGDQVAVDYTRNTQGVMIAQQIRPAGDVETAATTATEPRSELQAEPVETETELERDVESTVADIGEETEEGLEEVGDEARDVGEDIESAFQEDTVAENEPVGETAFDEGETTFEDETELPATGSSLPMVAFWGILTLGAAGAIRFFWS